MKYRYLFGPVPSRRLGRSLGVDLVPRKTCSFNCVFCQVGRTTNLTLERGEHVPTADVVAELDSWLKSGGTCDYITLSGSGEPTLHSRFGDVLDAVHQKCSIRAALLTNSSLLYLPEVRSAAARADMIKVSLSAWDQTSFEELNRPHSELTFKKVLEGIRAFRAEFSGELWLEVFVLFGLNARKQAMKKIAKLAETIRPDRIHLNTVARPPAEPYAIPVTRKALEKFVPLFDPLAEIIAEFESGSRTDWKVNEGEILAMLERRPCTAEDIAGVFGMNPNELAKHLEKLMRSGMIRQEQRGETVYYQRSAAFAGLRRAKEFRGQPARAATSAARRRPGSSARTEE